MHGNRARLLTTAVAVVMIAAAALPWVSRSATVARAGHGWPASTGLHVWSIHHSWAPEDYCWESYTASLTAIQVRDKLNETINGVGWDGTGSGRIDNVPTTTSCDYTPNAGSWVDMVYIAQNSVPCGDNGAYVTGNLCVIFLQPRYINGVIVDHWQALIWLATANITGTNSFMHALISHETGTCMVSKIRLHPQTLIARMVDGCGDRLSCISSDTMDVQAATFSSRQTMTRTLWSTVRCRFTTSLAC